MGTLSFTELCLNDMSNKDTQFEPGKSGNPGGRPKGSRNKITLQKMMLEETLRDITKDRMPQVVEKAFELALQGDRAMLKLLIELHMSKGISEERHAQEKVEINISTNKAESPKKDIDPSSIVLDKDTKDASSEG